MFFNVELRKIIENFKEGVKRSLKYKFFICSYGKLDFLGDGERGVIKLKKKIFIGMGMDNF